MRKKLLALLAGLSFGGTIDQILDSVVLGSYYAGPAVIKSPNYTTVTGPSLSFRLRRDLFGKPLVYLNPPRATLSCAGLDFDAGWLSLMNLDTLAQLLQQAGASYMWGIAIGLVYSLPGVGEAFDMLQKWGRYAQFLSMDACTAGIQAGRQLYVAFKEATKTDAVNRALSEGWFSTVSEALKNYKKNVDKTKVFGVYPYEVLAKAGITGDLADLIASFTGVYMFYPVADDGSVCSTESCMDNVRIYVLEPLDVNLDALVRGDADLEVYDCGWGVLSGPGVEFCTKAGGGALPKRKLSFSQGLKDRELSYLRSILTKAKTGVPLSSQEEEYLRRSPVSNLVAVLNALAFFEKSGQQELATVYLEELAYLQALLKLKAFVSSVTYALNEYVLRYANEKDATTEIFKHVEELKRRQKELEAELEERLAKVNRLNQTMKQWEEVRKKIVERIVAEFGSGAVFWR